MNYFIQDVAQRKLRLADASFNGLIAIHKYAIDVCLPFLASGIIVSNVRGQRFDAYLSQGGDEVVCNLSDLVSTWVLYPQGMNSCQEVER